MIQVTKRGGSKEPYDIDKIHRVVTWACEDLSGVSVSELELRAELQLFNNIKSSDIHETLVKAAADLISEESPNYQYVAGRLINYQIRKEVYGQYEPLSLVEHYSAQALKRRYDADLFSAYSLNEWEELGNYIKHDRDYLLTYAAMEQMRGKYLIQNRVTGQIFETPQMAFMLIAMTLFQNYKTDRIKWVKELYDAISTFDISLPTPIMAGVRTPDRQFSSCTLIESGDDLNSIFTTAHAIGRYVSDKAGIGIGAGAIRAEGSDVRGGRVKHTGVIPYYRLFQSAVKSCSQGGVRGGAATLHYPIWHLEFEELIVLKNNKGTDDNRIRHLDYSVQINRLMYQRLLEGGNITLFSPSDVPGLYEAFFNDPEKFQELYEKAERNTRLRKKTIPAIEIFSMFMQERMDTGRIYFQNVDHCNTHGSFIEARAPIRMSNLCQEITLPTKPLYSIDDVDGEISLCTLAAINWGKIKNPEDFEKPCTLAVRALDALLDYQSYPVAAARKGAMNRRPLGIGIINYAYWLAKNNLTYGSEDLSLVHQFAEAWSYYLIKASVDLAEEASPCPAHGDTKYSAGVMPIDTYKKDVDDIVRPEYKMDWGGLALRASTYGIRNSTLMALMPAETSAQISNSTNGIEPPRALVSIKQSKDGVLKQVVPEIHKRKNQYDLLWDQTSPEGYIRHVAVLQKFIDQSISTNVSYNPAFYENGEIPMSVLLGHLLMMYKYGCKTGYYHNIADGAGDEVSYDDDQENCDSCTI